MVGEARPVIRQRQEAIGSPIRLRELQIDEIVVAHVGSDASTWLALQSSEVAQQPDVEEETQEAGDRSGPDHGLVTPQVGVHRRYQEPPAPE